jgi:hypothetical protein
MAWNWHRRNFGFVDCNVRSAKHEKENDVSTAFRIHNRVDCFAFNRVKFCAGVSGSCDRDERADVFRGRKSAGALAWQMAARNNHENKSGRIQRDGLNRGFAFSATDRSFDKTIAQRIVAASFCSIASTRASDRIRESPRDMYALGGP